MSERSFHPRPDHEIHALSDEQILQYVVAARASGHPSHAARALQILVFGYQDIVRVRVGAKVPRHEADEVADAGLLRAIAAALKPDAFKGTSFGEFRKWMHTIVDRQVVDYWRKVERSPKQDPLPDEHEGDEDARRPVGAAADDTEAVDVQAVIDQALGELGEAHRAVIERYVFGDRTAAETADELGESMTENNVHQITSRFRRRMRELLDDSS